MKKLITLTAVAAVAMSCVAFGQAGSMDKKPTMQPMHKGMMHKGMMSHGKMHKGMKGMKAIRPNGKMHLGAMHHGKMHKGMMMKGGMMHTDSMKKKG